MKRRVLTNVFVLSCALALNACATTPTHFYTLLKAVEAPAAQRAAYAIDVQPVSVPSQVDVPQIVIRQSDGELALSEQHLWIAPLADELRAALSSELSTRLGAIDVYRVPRDETQSVFRVRTRVQRFETHISQSIYLQAIWTVETSDRSRGPIICSSNFTETAEGAYVSLTRAHQRALGRLAAEMSALIQQLANGESNATCPGQSKLT